MERDTAATTMMDGLFEHLSRCIRGEGERELLALRADADTQARIDQLAVRCGEGALSAEERLEYERYVRLINFIAILQAKVRGRMNT